MASWHCTVEFHSPCASSFGHTMLTLEERQMGSGAFRSVCVCVCVCVCVENRQMGGGGGGACIYNADRHWPWAERRQRLQTVHQKFGKSVLQFLTSTMKQQSLFAYLMHVSQGSKMYILKIFFSLSHFASTTAGIKLFHTGNVHAHLSPRLVADLHAVPYTHCRKSSASFTRFLARRQFLCLCLVSQCTHPLIKRAHFGPTLYAGLFQPSLTQWLH